jgi:Endoplasmic Reticulum Oxidoreductin 1 (ERO1)
MYSFFPSPRLNANLLQRSEVVALINTLHRFSESLHAVDDFRRLWRESDAEESAELIREAEKAVNIPVGYSRSQRCLSYSDTFSAAPAISSRRYERLTSCQLGRSDSATSSALGARLQGGHN